MKRVIKFLFLLNTLSVDVALGAVASSIFFSLIFETPRSILVLMSLGLSVWVIYTADHLLDVRNSKAIVGNTRHAFHQKNYQLMKLFLALGVVIDFGLVTQLPRSIVYAGSALATFVIAYLLFNKKLGASKELMAAVLYTSGVCLPALVFLEHSIQSGNRLLIIHFFLTALANLILFALIERDEDNANKRASIATLKGIKQVSLLLIMLFIILIGLFIIHLRVGGSWKPSAILFLMDIILGLLFLFQKTVFVKNYYRLIGDGIFLLPTLVLIG